MYGASKLKWLAKRRDGSTLFMISSYTVPWHRGQRSCTSGVRINLMTRFFRCSHIFGARNQRLAEKKPRGQRFVNLGHIRWVDRFQPPSPRLVFFAAILLLSKLSCWSLLRRPISSSLHRQKTDTLRRVSFFAPPPFVQRESEIIARLMQNHHRVNDVTSKTGSSSVTSVLAWWRQTGTILLCFGAARRILWGHIRSVGVDRRKDLAWLTASLMTSCVS